MKDYGAHAYAAIVLAPNKPRAERLADVGTVKEDLERLGHNPVERLVDLQHDEQDGVSPFQKATINKWLMDKAHENETPQQHDVNFREVPGVDELLEEHGLSAEGSDAEEAGAS